MSTHEPGLQGQRLAVLALHPLYDTRVANHLSACVDAGLEVTYFNWSQAGSLPKGMPALQKVRLVQRDESPVFGRSIGRYRAMLRWFREQAHGYDLYHLHDLFLLPLAPALSSRGRVVFDIHENYLAYRGLVSWFARVSYALHLGSVAGLVSTCAANVPAGARQPVVMVPNCQDREPFDRARAAMRSAEAAGEPWVRVVYFGSLAEEDRDVLMMLELAELCLSRSKQVAFEFGGPLRGPNSASFEQRMKKLEADYRDRFRWHGMMPREQVIERTAHADVGIIFLKSTSPNATGGSWNKIYEYLTVGAAILSTKGFDLEHEVVRQHAGHVYDFGVKASEVAPVLLRLIEQRDALAKMKAASEALGRAHGWEAVRDRYAQLYRTLLPASGVKRATTAAGAQP